MRRSKLCQRQAASRIRAIDRIGHRQACIGRADCIFIVIYNGAALGKVPAAVLAEQSQLDRSADFGRTKPIGWAGVILAEQSHQMGWGHFGKTKPPDGLGSFWQNKATRWAGVILAEQSHQMGWGHFGRTKPIPPNRTRPLIRHHPEAAAPSAALEG